MGGVSGKVPSDPGGRSNGLTMSFLAFSIGNARGCSTQERHGQLATFTTGRNAGLGEMVLYNDEESVLIPEHLKKQTYNNGSR